MSKSNNQVTSASVSSYFAKNLQQVGFSSPIKAVLTTLKEAVDNSLDACEESEILPEITVIIEKLGSGNHKNTDQIRVLVEDNGPGIPEDAVAKVFGEYLASSKFGRGRCSRGQQGIGISSSVTWAQLSNATGVKVITKTKNAKKAMSCTVEVDIQHNQGIIKNEQKIDWDRPHGTSVEFIIDGKVQLNGEAGLISYLTGTSLVNPHLTLRYTLPDMEKINIERVSQEIPAIPEATEPHPHTMKLGEFIAHSHLSHSKVGAWLKTDFSRISDATIKDLVGKGIPRKTFDTNVDALADVDFKNLFTAIQNIELMPPSTRSVLSIGEESLAKSIKRLGDVDFFAVVTRKPTICDFKPIQVEIAMARLLDKPENDTPVQILRFANRVPLQFDKSACAIFQSISSVNWKAYGLNQPKDSVPTGPYIIAVSVVSPFIKFKNASKETIDGSEELIEEIRLALIQAGQKLSKYIKKETKANELEEKIRHIEKFAPILVQTICRITNSSDSRKKKAEAGLRKLLGRDTADAEKELKQAETVLEKSEEKYKNE
jgi:DNA topoisomerase-6 subunit B